MGSAAWFWDPSTGTAFVAISAGDDVCSEAETFTETGEAGPVLILQLLEFNGSAGTYSASALESVDASDGSTDVIPMAYLPTLGATIPMPTGAITVTFADELDVLDISSFSVSNDFGESVSGSFEACWCTAIVGLSLMESGGEPDEGPPPDDAPPD
jgi:hypothetical protein